MGRFAAAVTILLFIALGTVFYLQKASEKSKNSPEQRITSKQSKNMKIASPAFENNTNIPSKYTCDGENISPALLMSDVPEEAKSLALIVDDPDAPAAGGFVHWVVLNIDPAQTKIEENSFPQNSIVGTNSAGQKAFASPCPPSGTHRYFFKLYALDAKLDLASSAKREDVEKAMAGHILDQAELIGLYKRQ
jgi:Raf kinase inhibitor-like YbhB/YbcL family protein